LCVSFLRAIFLLSVVSQCLISQTLLWSLALPQASPVVGGTLREVREARISRVGGLVRKSTLSPCVCWGGLVASVTGSRPAAVRPLAPSQRVPSPRAASPACGPPFFLPCALLVCVQLAKCVPNVHRAQSCGILRGSLRRQVAQGGLGLFRSRIRRVWGHAATFAWSDLILDRSRKLAGLQSPAACATRAGGDSDPDFENCDIFHAQSPGTGRGVHARSWRVNRDADVRR